jgi:uncharacterized membrane protein
MLAPLFILLMLGMVAYGKTIKTVSTRNVTQSLTTSLINNLSLSVKALGLGLPCSER